VTVYQFVYTCSCTGRPRQGMVSQSAVVEAPGRWWERLWWALSGRTPRPTMRCEDCQRRVPVSTWREMGGAS
jgi:hypothetical protein